MSTPIIPSQAEVYTALFNLWVTNPLGFKHEPNSLVGIMNNHRVRIFQGDHDAYYMDVYVGDAEANRSGWFTWAQEGERYSADANTIPENSELVLTILGQRAIDQPAVCTLTVTDTATETIEYFRKEPTAPQLDFLLGQYAALCAMK